MEHNCEVKVEFNEQSKGYVAKVAANIGASITKEEAERVANLAYDTALATFEKATTYTYTKTKDKR